MTNADPSATGVTKESTVASDPVAQPVNGVWFVTSCLLLPVLWGVLVHQIFKRLRSEDRPDRQSESSWPDYQI